MVDPHGLSPILPAERHRQGATRCSAPGKCQARRRPEKIRETPEVFPRVGSGSMIMAI